MTGGGDLEATACGRRGRTDRRTQVHNREGKQELCMALASGQGSSLLASIQDTENNGPITISSFILC